MLGKLYNGAVSIILGGNNVLHADRPQVWDDPAAVNPERRVNRQMVFDRTGRLPKDAVTVVSVFSR